MGGKNLDEIIIIEEGKRNKKNYGETLKQILRDIIRVDLNILLGGGAICLHAYLHEGGHIGMTELLNHIYHIDVNIVSEVVGPTYGYTALIANSNIEELKEVVDTYLLLVPFAGPAVSLVVNGVYIYLGKKYNLPGLVAAGLFGAGLVLYEITLGFLTGNPSYDYSILNLALYPFYFMIIKDGIRYFASKIASKVKDIIRKWKMKRKKRVYRCSHMPARNYVSKSKTITY